MKKTFIIFLLLLTTCIFTTAQQNASISFEQFLSLRQCGNPVVSPDGDNVAFTVTSTDWKENSYDTEIWLSIKGEEPFQLTRTLKGSSTSPKWSPDGKWVAFLADRGEKTQVFVIKTVGGEAQAATKEEEGIQSFDWSPNGKFLAFTKNEPESKKQKSTDRKSVV